VLQAITRCRTAALGGHRDQCSDCGHTAISYNSCRNRHCPRCQGNARQRWLQARQRELLPASYVHVVFTLPRELAPLALQNKRLIYNLLFHTSAATLQEIARDPRHFGGALQTLRCTSPRPFSLRSATETQALSLQWHTRKGSRQAHPDTNPIVPRGGFLQVAVSEAPLHSVSTPSSSLGGASDTALRLMGSQRDFPKHYLGSGSCLLRKYICGVVPSIFRNISINALTLS
jgi:transposase-like zinc-binding protein